MERWTIKQLDSLSDLRFAQAILSERVNRLSQPYSPLATKLRSAVNTLNRLAEEEERGQQLPDFRQGVTGVVCKPN